MRTNQNLRTDKEHWAQRLKEDGYKTGLLGKWHVERTNKLHNFGWDTYNYQDKANDEYDKTNKVHKQVLILVNLIFL